MNRYRYFIFNQRNMVVLGLFQIACATVCIISGLIDGAFRKESALSKSKIPIWAGMFMSIPGIMALYSSQKKNPILVNAMIIASVLSCFTTLTVIIYASMTLEYGEKYEGSNNVSFNHPAIELKAAPSTYFLLNYLCISALAFGLAILTSFFFPWKKKIVRVFVLGKLVEGANITMMISSIFSIFIVLVIVYVGCRSLPRCSCYDSITGLEQLKSNEDQLQITELVCLSPDQADKIFNSPVQFPQQNTETDNELSEPPPYIRLT